MYSLSKAKDYWEKRIKESAKLSAVLYFSENEMINLYYDLWEKTVIRQELGEVKEKFFLDIPIGIGRWTNELLRLGAMVDGVDISMDIINKAKKSIDEKLLSHVSFYVAAASEIGTMETKYDCILCTGLFEHLPKEIYLRCIDDFYKILKKGGQLILVINNKDSVLIKEAKDNIYRVSEQYENGYYCGLTDINEVQFELKKIGFQISHYATNPAFSLARQILRDDQSNSNAKTILEKAVQIDTDFFSCLDTYQNNLSDQIIIYGRKEENEL